MKNEAFIAITRPDGAKLYMNINQIVYVTRDPADESGKKTEIVTTEGAFRVNQPVEAVLELLAKGKGEL